MSLRHQLSEYHPIFGDDFRMLKDWEEIEPNDESACISTMLSLEGDTWCYVEDSWGCIGKTVEWYCTESEDCDRDERIFRRRREC